MTLFISTSPKRSLTKTILTSFLHFLLPARCLMCRDVVEEIGSQNTAITPSLCAFCWGGLTFLSQACCDRCGIPFEVTNNSLKDLTCLTCLKDAPPFSQAKSALLYDDHSKHLILRFKHGDAIHMAPTFGAWLNRAGSEMIQETDYFVPVPLHWRRLLKRQYNQAALLTNALSQQSGIPSLLEGLERIEHTPTQGYLTKEERHKNVSGKFAVPAKNIDIVNKKVITLIDDVYTSGATVKACAMALKRAGAAKVNVLTLARVARL